MAESTFEREILFQLIVIAGLAKYRRSVVVITSA
jgi:hypothetical protein